MEKIKFLILCGFLCAALIVPSFALQCYFCDTFNNPKCANLPDDSIKPQNCTWDKLQNTQGSLLMELTHVNVPQGKEPTYVCQKVEAFDEGSHAIKVIRRCQVDGPHSEHCNLSTNQKLKEANTRIQFCGLCSDDGCNGAVLNSISGKSVILFSTILIALRLFE